jgi:hypothetical protein
VTRQVIGGAWYGEQLPTGEWAAMIPHVGVQSHLGSLGNPEAFGPLYIRCTNVPSFRCAGQAHDTIEPACWEWNGSWQPHPQPCCGESPVIFDLHGVRYQHPCGPGEDSNGYRYVTPDNVIVGGKETYGPWNGLSQYTDLFNGLWIGQGHDNGGVCVWDGTTLRLLEAGACTFIRATREGDTVGLAFHSVEAGGVVLMLLLMDELFALPPVVPPVDPPPVIPPVEPPPIDPPPVIPPVIPPPITPPSQYRSHKEWHMATDTVGCVRGPGGLLGRPDNPHTGPWASLGWRGMVFDGHDKGDARYHFLRPGTQQDALISQQTGAVVGCDATIHSGGLDKQFYVKPDGETGQGWAEQWQFYTGNKNGAIQAQIEYRPGAGGDEGAFFAYSLAFEPL